MNDTKKSPEGTDEKSFFSVIVHSFFIIPFLIAVFALLLFAGVKLLTQERSTVYDLLENVKVGGLNKRWQAAFELSKILGNEKVRPHDTRFNNELISAFEQSFHDDPRVRQYLALSMGRMEDPVFFEPLTAKIDQEKEETLLAVIYGIGSLKDKRGVAVLAPFLEHRNPRVRSMTVVAIGNIAVPEALPVLKKALTDSEPNVQWGAAIALGQMKDASGKEILLRLLNRQYLGQFQEVDQGEQDQLILSAVQAVSAFQDKDIQEALKELAEKDINMKVRIAASAVLSNK